MTLQQPYMTGVLRSMDGKTAYEQRRATQQRVSELERELAKAKNPDNTNNATAVAFGEMQKGMAFTNTVTQAEMLNAMNNNHYERLKRQLQDLKPAPKLFSGNMSQKPENVLEAVLEVRGMLQGLDERLTKVEDRIQEADTAKRSLMGEDMNDGDTDSDVRQTVQDHVKELKRLRSSVAAIARSMAKAPADKTAQQQSTCLDGSAAPP